MGKAAGIASLRSLMSSTDVVLMDGALGTELERLGYKTSLPLWSASAILDAADLIEKIHIDYINNGAQIITANTFRTGRYTLSKEGIGHRAGELTAKAVQIARAAIQKSGREVLLAGSIAPLEDCYEPDLVPADQIIEQEYRDQITALVSSGVDLILVETMINRQEALILAKLLSDSNTPYIMSFTAGVEGKLLDGTPLEEIVIQVQDFSPTALMLNCREPKIITQNLAILDAHCSCPFGAYANGSGQAGGDTGWVWDHQMEDSTYISNMMVWLDMGARLVGGCCGTSPETIKQMLTAIARRG